MPVARNLPPIPHLILASALALGTLACPALAVAADEAPPAPAAVKPPPQSADVAAPKHGKDGQVDKAFLAAHESFLKRGKEGPIGVLFLGDSITAGWKGGGKEVWQERYAALQAANFGIGGDRTQHVLWRMDQGELDGIRPKVLVLMIGTNNMGDTAENITKGDLKIISGIHARLPETRLLLLGIFPRGADPKDAGVAGMRAKIKAVNAELAKLDDGAKTFYLDIGASFLDADGVLPKDVMPDALHPNSKGYRIWAEAMQPLLDRLLK
jgi:lysophospholipase L1-like esterase